MKKINKFLAPLMIALSLTVTSCGALPNFGGPGGHGDNNSQEPDKPNDNKPGQDGKPGQNGTDGTSLLTGTTKPGDNIGKPGDSYINTRTWDFYVKEKSGWVLKGNIKGQDGKPGTDGNAGQQNPTIISGYGEPSYGLGNEEDTYINLSNSDFYVKKDGQWKKIGNIGNATDTQSYTVTFDTGTPDITVESQTVNKGDKVNKPYDWNMQRTGYEFKGWYYQDEPWSFIGYVVTENMTLTAKWEQKKYSIHYYDLDMDKEIGFGDTIYHPYISKDYAEFLGWYNGDVKIEDHSIYNYDYDLYLSPKFVTVFPAAEYVNSVKTSTKHPEMNPQINSPTFEISNIKLNGNNISFSATKEQYSEYVALYKMGVTTVSEDFTYVTQPSNNSLITINYDGSKININTTYYDGKTSTWPTKFVETFLSKAKADKTFTASQFELPVKANWDVNVNNYETSLSINYKNVNIKNLYVNLLKGLKFEVSSSNENRYVHPDSSIYVDVSGYENNTTITFNISKLNKDLINSYFKKFMLDETAEFIWPNAEIYDFSIYGYDEFYCGFNTNNKSSELIFAEWDQAWVKAGYKFKVEGEYTYFYKDSELTRFRIDRGNNYFYMYFEADDHGYSIKNDADLEANYKKYVTNVIGCEIPRPDTFEKIYVDFNFNYNDTISLDYTALNNEDIVTPYKTKLEDLGYKLFNGYYYNDTLKIRVVEGRAMFDSLRLEVCKYGYKENINGSQIKDVIYKDFFITPELNNVTLSGVCTYLHTPYNYNSRIKKFTTFEIFGDPKTIMSQIEQLFAGLDYTKDALGYANDQIQFIINGLFENKVTIKVNEK